MCSVYVDNCIKYDKLSYNELVCKLADIFANDIKHCIRAFDETAIVEYMIMYKALCSSKLSVRVYKFDKFRNIEFEVQSLFTDISNLLYNTMNKNIRNC